MKAKWLVLSAILQVGSAHLQAQLILRTGESFSHEFSELPYQYSQPGVFPVTSQFGFSVVPGSFEPGTVLQYEMFANSFAEPPIRVGTVTNMPPYRHADVPFGALGAWGDGQGAVRLTVLTGSLILGEVTAGVSLPRDNRIQDYFATNVVPSPRLLHRMEFSWLQLSWTTNAVEYRLESSVDITASTWQPVTTPARIEGGNYILEVDVWPNETARYFRLSKP